MNNPPDIPNYIVVVVCIIFVVSNILSYLLGRGDGYCKWHVKSMADGMREANKLAVKEGVARWVTDIDGNVSMEYIKPSKST